MERGRKGGGLGGKGTSRARGAEPEHWHPTIFDVLTPYVVSAKIMNVSRIEFYKTYHHFTLFGINEVLVIVRHFDFFDVYQPRGVTDDPKQHPPW